MFAALATIMKLAISMKVLSILLPAIVVSPSLAVIPTAASSSSTEYVGRRDRLLDLFNIFDACLPNSDDVLENVRVGSFRWLFFLIFNDGQRVRRRNGVQSRHRPLGRIECDSDGQNVPRGFSLQSRHWRLERSQRV